MEEKNINKSEDENQIQKKSGANIDKNENDKNEKKRFHQKKS